MKKYDKLVKISETEWKSNSDVCGYIVRLKDGKYYVYYFDKCYADEEFFEEVDSNLSYLQNEYRFEI